MLTGPHALGHVVLKYMQENPEAVDRVRFLSRFNDDAVALEDTPDVAVKTNVSGKYMVHRMRGSWVNF